jgi:hypothetical protein
MEQNLVSVDQVATDPLINICVEGWRFAKLFTRVVNKLDAAEQAKYLSKVRYFMKQVEDTLNLIGISLVSLEGQPFEPGLPVNAINIGDFADNSYLVVDQMLEPVVMGPSGLIRMGSVLLRKADQ